MLVKITNTPRDYAWGSPTALPELLGTLASGRPEAELWLGAHAGSPSRIVDPAKAGGALDLQAWIAADPVRTLGPLASTGHLPFLLKILAAASPLSLQAHPTPGQAVQGFARENALGIPLDAPERNYRDPYPKPELIYALSPTFDALCGFRPVDEVKRIVGAFLALAPGAEPLVELLRTLETDDAPRSTLELLLSGGSAVQALVAQVIELAPAVSGWELETATVTALATDFPGDPGIVASLLLNRVTLVAGEALFLPAGNVHAYLAGVGVELMTASDNVLRGGLTRKHIDVKELLGILDFRPAPVPYLSPENPCPGVEVFRPPGQDFELVRVTDDAVWIPRGPAIVFCARGEFTLNGTPLAQGGSLYATPDEKTLAISGTGELFLATTGA